MEIIATERPHMLLKMYNACLTEGVFPEVWKRQKLVLIDKGKGNIQGPSSKRPLAMLDVPGKLLEKLLKPRLTAALNAVGGLSNSQHGFRQGRSTRGAIQDVIASVGAAQWRNHYSRRIV